MNNSIRNIQLVAVVVVLISTIIAFFLEMREMYENRNITVLSRKTKNKAYSMKKVSFEENKTFNKKKVENFIKFHSKQLNKG